MDSTLIKRCKNAVLPTGAVDRRTALPRKSRASGTWSVVQSLKAVTARLTSAQLPPFGFVEECYSEVLGSVVTMSDKSRERAGVATGEMATFGSGARESAQPHGLHDGGSAPPQCQTRENQKSALIYSLSAPPTSGWITARVCSDHQQYRVLVRPQNTSSLFCFLIRCRCGYIMKNWIISNIDKNTLSSQCTSKICIYSSGADTCVHNVCTMQTATVPELKISVREEIILVEYYHYYH